MKKAIMAKKIGMTQVFSETGNLIPVTVLEAGPCAVVQKKTVENDGYSAIQVGFIDEKENKVTKPEKGHFEKAGVAAKKFLSGRYQETRSAQRTCYSRFQITQSCWFYEFSYYTW